MLKYFYNYEITYLFLIILHLIHNIKFNKSHVKFIHIDIINIYGIYEEV